ncbi:hypothetical protein NLM59_10230 [Weeksellaceae bacterium KMM 9724]|uniref:hypothetical protein n=1 Tax=Profundicola chukchiensis TaxID=2961959 RepID=UPI0024401E9A|nr:hypothetical protein [Profundicola chukchiensis]MDG4951304.1 hypothetical protein [Profundicola chukchiensis]
MKNYTLIILLIIFSSNAYSQIKAISENGDEVILFENGTWEKTNTTKSIKTINTTVEAKAEIDKFTKSKKIITEQWIYFGKDNSNYRLSGNLYRIDNLTFFNFSYTGDIGCFSEFSSKLEVLLSNGEVIAFSQVGNTECGKNSRVSFLPISKEQQNDKNFQYIHDENLKLLKQHNWETIRLTGSEFYTDIIPNKRRNLEKPEQFFREHITAADSK